MEYIYSIEDGKEKIANSKTKEYFEEVYISYQHGNYRSCIVMLWSVIICDIIYKLEELVSVYNDPNAQILLSDFNKKLIEKTKSSEWEKQLVDSVAKSTSLIEYGTLKTIEHIQQYRHISAHPAFEQSYELFIPNKDLCRGLIISILSGLLTKPAFYTKKIFDDFIQDISKNKEVLITHEQISIYIETKYLKHLNQSVVITFIKSLWKLVFGLDNDDCNINRVINRRILDYLTEKSYPVAITEEIKKNVDYYSGNIKPDTANILAAIYYYFSQFPDLYKLLRDDVKILIKGKRESWIYTILTSRFLYSNWDEFENELIISIDGMTILNQIKDLASSDIEKIKTLYKANDKQSIMFKVFSIKYGSSGNFDAADSNFIKYIEPNIDFMMIDDFKYLLSRIEDNSQTYGRGRAGNDHKKIADRILSLEPGFNFEDYPKFSYCLEIDEDD